jgi:hypothetical protein
MVNVEEKESSQGTYKIYQRGKEMTCQIIFNTPLYNPDLKLLKVKTVAWDCNKSVPSQQFDV